MLCFLQVLSLPRSPVFRGMLESGMLEELKGRVQVEDAEPVILRQLVRYLYTGRVEPDFRDYKKLMVLANKYQVEDLVDYTSSKILETLKVENALELGIFGESHNSTILLNASAKVIMENAREAIVPEGWEQQMKGSPRLLLAIVAALWEAGRKKMEFHRFTSSDLLLKTGLVGTAYAIDFKVSTAAVLLGIGLYGVAGDNKVAIKIFKAGLMPPDALLLFNEIREYSTPGGGEHTKVKFGSLVNLEPNVAYTIYVENLSGHNLEVTCGRKGKTPVEIGNVAVTFSNSSYSVSGTDVHQGQIPSIYLRVSF